MVNRQLKNIIGLQCTGVKHGQAIGMLRLFFGSWKFNIECDWSVKINQNVILNQDTIKSVKDRLPELEGRKVLKINLIAGILSDIQLQFDHNIVFNIKNNDTRYEAWQLYKDDKLVLVAGPGDQISEWPLKE